MNSINKHLSRAFFETLKADKRQIASSVVPSTYTLPPVATSDPFTESVRKAYDWLRKNDKS